MSHFKMKPLLTCFLGISIAAATPSRPEKAETPFRNPTQTEKTTPAKPDKTTKPDHQKMTSPANPALAPTVAPEEPEEEQESQEDDGPDCNGCILAESGTRSNHGTQKGGPMALAGTLWGLFGVRRPNPFKGKTHIKGIAVVV